MERTREENKIEIVANNGTDLECIICDEIFAPGDEIVWDDAYGGYVHPACRDMEDI